MCLFSAYNKKKREVKGAMKNRTVEHLWNVLICLGLVSLVGFFSMLFTMMLFIAQENNGHRYTRIDVFAICLFCVLAAFILLRLSEGLDLFFFDLKFLTKRNLQIMLAASASLLFVSGLETILLKQGLLVPQMLDPELRLFFDKIPLLIVVLFTAILTPIMEEVVFRGGIIGLVFKEHKLLGVLISGVLYCVLMGPATPLYSGIYLLMNGILGLSYIKTQRLIVPMLIHIVTGLLASLLTVFLL